MITWAKIRKLRELILKASAHLSDDDAFYGAELFPAWKPGISYIIGERIQFGGTLSKVNQDHTAQSDWTPDITPALYTAVPAPGEIPDWKQPTGAQDAYMIGDKVRHNGKVWVCTSDYNVYEPGVFGWDEVA